MIQMTRWQSRNGPRNGHRPHWLVGGVVLLLHVVVILGLIRAFTPDFAAQAVRAVTQVFDVPLPSPPAPKVVEEVNLKLETKVAPKDEGQSGAAGRKASPREVSAPKAQIVITPSRAPPITGNGLENASGAVAEGEGTGAAGNGTGTGAGRAGAGNGGGGGSSPTVKIFGDINSAKDYPRESRNLRMGASVIIDLTVGADGRVHNCRIVQPSPDPSADRITCQLASQRFRFKPARNASGAAVEAVYRWRQRWF